jgi:hypothetical protein
MPVRRQRVGGKAYWSTRSRQDFTLIAKTARRRQPLAGLSNQGHPYFYGRDSTVSLATPKIPRYGAKIWLVKLKVGFVIVTLKIDVAEQALL